jgi:8-amino-7-oxononanoate synthase
VLGEQGGGICEAYGLTQKQVPVLMATLGKGLGGYGAFVAGEKALIEYLVQFARSYIYTTAMPAAIASANLANLEVLKNNPKILTTLKSNIRYFKTQCAQKGIALLPSDTAIQPLVIGSNEKLNESNNELLASGYLVGAIRPPTVPENSARLRITISAGHNETQIGGLVNALDCINLKRD